MVGGQQVYFGRQDVSRVAAEEVGIGEDTETTGVDDTLNSVLGFLELFLAGNELGVLANGLGNASGQFGSLGNVCAQATCNVDEVKSMQMIEMHDVIMHELGGKHQVADNGSIMGQLFINTNCVINAADGSKRVHVGADTAGTLGKVLSIAGITPFQDDLQTTEQLRAAADIDDLAVFDNGFHAKMTFDSGDRVNYDIVFPFRHGGGFGSATRHIVSSLRILILSA